MRTPSRVIALAVACLLIACPVFAQEFPGPDIDRLVAEAGGSARMEDGVLRVRRSDGWVRTRRIFGDFGLSAHIRLVSESTELVIGIRTVNTRDQPLRRSCVLRISSKKPAAVPASPCVIDAQPLAAITPTVGDWHVVTVIGKGPHLEIAIDDQLVGRYTIAARAGSILLQARGDDAEVSKISFDAFPPEGAIRAADYRDRPGWRTPVLVKSARPGYTRNAMNGKVQGVVNLEAVVLADGTVGAVWLTKLLDPDLEHTALDAVRRWQFTPGELNGSPVDTIVEIELTFSLRK